MSTTYELITESLNEIISDLEETGGENLKREKKSAVIDFKKHTKSTETGNENYTENRFDDRGYLRGV